MTFPNARFWPAFDRAGMLVAATPTTTLGERDPIKVSFHRPDVAMLGGQTLSTDYQIEYQYADCPELAEGDVIVIDGEPTSYRVRSAPFVPEFVGMGMDGYFRRALLSRVLS